MNIKKWLHHILSGIRTGSTVYLIVIALSIQKSAPTIGNIISVFVLSGLIGMLRPLFDIFDERFAHSTLLLFHFLAVAVLACCFMVYNNWGFLIANWHFWLDFILIYLFVWLFLYLDTNLKTKKINSALAKRRREKEGK